MPYGLLGQCCPGGGSGGGGCSTIVPWVVAGLAVGLWYAARWTRRTWKRDRSPASKVGKVVLIAAVVSGIVTLIGLRIGQSASPMDGAVCPVGPPQFSGQPTLGESATASAAATPRSSGVPRLLDLGSTSCVPCKMLAPILDDLKKDYAGRLDVEFIDVWVKENAVKAKEFGIKVIPTQIFFDGSGKELWRHEGYISKDDILAKWKELGCDFSESGPSGETRPCCAAQPEPE